ncbi:conjugal transfer protein TraX [Candidatus Bathyarchaeota archaeon]|nr:conjugal transfer protein TraX [Candidatus Bathyarchaeota archaeon]
MNQHHQTQNYDTGREILKWIALITMTIDHIGAILFPEYEFLRVIGRLSFPIFGYLVVLGVESTRNVRNYFLRLFLFALISQVPFYLALGYPPFESLNIFFTLSFGVLSLTNPLMIVVSLFASALLNFDYNVYGIGLIIAMRVLKDNTKYGVMILIILNIIFVFASPIQIFSLLALPIIILYKNGVLNIERAMNERHLKNSFRKYLFYSYYPIHLTVLYIIKSHMV